MADFFCANETTQDPIDCVSTPPCLHSGPDCEGDPGAAAAPGSGAPRVLRVRSPVPARGGEGEGHSAAAWVGGGHPRACPLLPRGWGVDGWEVGVQELSCPRVPKCRHHQLPNVSCDPKGVAEFTKTDASFVTAKVIFGSPNERSRVG